MAIITPPLSDSTNIQGGISPGSALGIGASAAQVGEAAQQGAKLVARNAEYIGQLSQQFFDDAKAATDTAAYSSAMNSAIVQLAQAKQNRYSQQVDDKGNPTFDRLGSDITDIGNSIVEGISKNIRSPEVMEKFKINFNNIMANTQIEALSEARKQQEGYVTAQVSTSFKTLGQMASAGSVIDATAGIEEYSRQVNTLVQAGALSFEAAEKTKSDFVRQVSENRISRIIETDPSLALTALAQDANPEMLMAEGIFLDEAQRLHYSRQAQSAVNNQLRMLQANEAARVDSIKELYSETNRLIERGGTPDPQTMNIMATAAQGTPLSAKVAELQDKAQRVSLFSSLSSLDREAVLNKMRAEGQLTDDYELYNRINGNLKQAQDKDLFSFAISQRVITPPRPIDINGDLGSQLAQRRNSMALIKGHYGQSAVGVTNEELDAIVEKMNTLAPNEKAKMFGQIVGGLGSNSLDLFSKMAKNGNRSYATIGALVVQGREDLASKVMVGRQFMENGQLQLAPAFNKESAADAAKVLPPIGLPDFFNDVIDLAKGLYAQKTVAAKDYSTEYDRNRWKESLEEVMGGEAISLNPKGKGFWAQDYVIVPPVKGMDAKGFTNWVSSISDSDINALGGWNGWTSGMSKQLQLAKFEQVGLGKYMVLMPSEMSESQFSPVYTKAGKVFTIDYEKIQDLRSGASLKDVPIENTSKFRVDDVYKSLARTPKALTNVDDIIAQASSEHGVDEKLIRAVIAQESGGKKDAVSPKGASGLMQLMPSTAKELGVKDLFDPQQNINAGVKYLSQMIKKYDGDLSKALAAYNAGPGVVDKVGGVPNWKETKKYVKNILAKL